MPRGAHMRLDELVVVRGLASSRSAARALIMAGLVTVAGEVRDKAGLPVAADAPVQLKERPRFVSRAGDKLDAALEEFHLEVTGRWALDVGASTGGFVDCLLQRGAGGVIALDVGRGQLDARLRGDPRVHVIEGVNARYATPGVLPWEPDLLTMDLSFISVTKVLPAVAGCMAPAFTGVVLVKPQFEAGPKQVGRAGVVRDPEVHRRVLAERCRFVAEDLGLAVLGVCRSARPGTRGNVEFFIHCGRGGEEGVGVDTLERLVDRAVFADEQ